MTYTPLSSTQHGNLCLTRGTFFYLQNQSMVPVSVVEAGSAALDLPLAFTRREDNTLALMAVLSLDQTDNAQVGPKGLWMGGYMPAIIRAHPFSMVLKEGQGTVLVDTGSDWLATAEGQPLFDQDGSPTEVLNRRIELLKNQAPNPGRDKPALDAIDQSGILAPWSEVSANLFRVDSQKLAALDDQVFLGLRQENALAVIYAQLMSMPRINRIKNLTQRKQKMQSRTEEVDVDRLFGGDDDILRFDNI